LQATGPDSRFQVPGFRSDLVCGLWSAVCGFFSRSRSEGWSRFP
jgi:hypothetical protein